MKNILRLLTGYKRSLSNTISRTPLTPEGGSSARLTRLFILLFLCAFAPLRDLSAQKAIHELPAKTTIDTNYLFIQGNPTTGKLYKTRGAALNALISGGGGTATDTTSIDLRINLKQDLFFNSISFTPSIPFNKGLTKMPTYYVTDSIGFSIDTTDQFGGASCIILLVANGIDEPTFTDFKISTNSSQYDNRSGMTNAIYFFYDGYNYWVNIWQEKDAIPLDIEPPVLQSAVINNETNDRVVLTYDEALNASITPSTSDYSIPGKTITGVSISGSTVLIDVSVAFEPGDTVTISYTAGTNKIQDAVGNISADLSSESVTNNISAGYVGAVWDTVVSATDSGNGEITSTGGAGGGHQATAITLSSTFEVIYESTSAAAILMIDSDLDGNYVWNGGQSYIFGLFKNAGISYISTSFSTTISRAYDAVKIRIKKSGNDAVIDFSTDGTTFIDPETLTDAFLGLSSVYLKAVLAIYTGGEQLKVYYKN